MHGTLRFLYLSHLLCGICVKTFLMNRYISKSYTTSKNTIDRQYRERGADVVSTITSTVSIEKISICLNRGREELVGNDDVSIVCVRKYKMVRMT